MYGLLNNYSVVTTADGTRGDEVGTSLSELDQQQCSRIRPTLAVVPFPSILVGYA